jgi:hypothetical protein
MRVVRKPAAQMTFFAERQKKVPPVYEVRTHIALADLLRAAITPGWVWFHVPNGGKREHIVTATGKVVSPSGLVLKRMGARAGVSDFVLIAPPDGCAHTLEIKREGEKLRDEQYEFLSEVKATGARAGWADNYEDAKKLLKRWGALDRLVE